MTTRPWLITGGLGFIGVNLVGKLLADGHAVRIFDNFSTGSIEALQAMFDGEAVPEEHRAHVDVVRGDICDAEAIRRASAGCAQVVHLAAHTNVIESVEKPSVCWQTNAVGTQHVMDAARLAEVDGVVVASSSAAVGEVDPPVHEQIIPHPVSPYGASKLAGEALASGYAGAYGLRAMCLRFSNVYGPYSVHKGSVVALFMKQILANATLTLYDQGEPTRDYIHVSDIVQGIVRAAEHGKAGRVYQIATGTETSVVELVDLLRAVTGRAIETRSAPPRAGEIRRNYSDITRAREELLFRPCVSLEDGVAKLWPWFRHAWPRRSQ